MTHEEKMQLAKAQGILESALGWAEIQHDVANDRLDAEDDPFARGLSWGEIAVAKDAVASLKKALALIEPLWKGPSDE